MSQTSAWREKLATTLPLLGHRNWIVIADSAYPEQVGDGVVTVLVDGEYADVVTTVMDAIDAASHVMPVVYLDDEIVYLDEADCPGITSLREQLDAVLTERIVNYQPHESIIKEIDQASRLFRVLVLKTSLVIPYTSVFLRLDCGYWSPEAESRLRQRMNRGVH